jgi:hypothetical protein
VNGAVVRHLRDLAASDRHAVEPETSRLELEQTDPNATRRAVARLRRIYARLNRLPCPHGNVVGRCPQLACVGRRAAEVTIPRRRR